MKELSHIPLDELLNDLGESERDVVVCEIALEQHLTTYKGRNIQERLQINRDIISLIKNEIKRRQSETK